jgi:hypothetical protein
MVSAQVLELFLSMALHTSERYLFLALLLQRLEPIIKATLYTTQTQPVVAMSDGSAP